MSNRIQPDESILTKLASKDKLQSPFSRIPFFLKEYILHAENSDKIATVLHAIGAKELEYLQTKVENIQNSMNAMSKNRYDELVELENGLDAKWVYNQKKLQEIAKQLLIDELWPNVGDIIRRMDITIQQEPIDPSVFDNHFIDNSGALSPEEQSLIQKEQQVRIIMNAITMGAWHRIFDVFHKESKYAKAINTIDSSMYQTYYDMVYSNLKHMRETPIQENQRWINTWSVQLKNNGKDVKLDIKANVFPVMLHEMAKGTVEYLAYERYNNLSTDMRQSILSVDSRSDEHWMMLVWPQIYKQFLFLIKEAVSQYEEKNGLVWSKKANEYILPLLSMIMQLPADEFLQYTELLLRGGDNGNESIAFIHWLINQMHEAYSIREKSRFSSKAAMKIEDIIVDLSKEFEINNQCQKFIETYLPIVEEKLSSAWYAIYNKKLARKLGEYFPIFMQKYGVEKLDSIWILKPSEWVDSSFLSLLDDTIAWWKGSRIEVAWFSVLRPEQKKKSVKAKDLTTKETIYIQPKFTLAQLHAAKENLAQRTRDSIDNEIHELVAQWSVVSWFWDHDIYSKKIDQLTEEMITLDDIAPECIAAWDNNRWLYNLVNEEQLKRESSMMWWHCTNQKATDVRNWSVVILSLRHGIQSRWTIWYEPSSKKIVQVKWYTNRKMNSILEKNEPDFSHVMTALAQLCEFYEVTAIGDIKDEFLQWYIMKEGTKYTSVKAFIERDADIEQFYWVKTDIDMNTSLKTVWDTKSMSLVVQKWHAIDKNIFALHTGNDVYFPRHIHLQVHIKVSGWAHQTLLLKRNDHNEYDTIFSGAYLSINFSAPGLLPGEAIVCDKSMEYGMIQKRGDTYEEVLPCLYNEINCTHKFNTFGPNEMSEYIIVKNNNEWYSVVKRTDVWEYPTVTNHQYMFPIVFEFAPHTAKVKRERHSSSISEIWLLQYNPTNWTREEILPSEYSAIGKPYESWLYNATSRPYSYLPVEKWGKFWLYRMEFVWGLLQVKQVLECQYDNSSLQMIQQIWSYRYNGLWNDEVILKRANDGDVKGYYNILKQNPDATFTVLFEGDYDITNWAKLANGDIILAKSTWWLSIVKKQNDGLYHVVFDIDHHSIQHKFEGVYGDNNKEIMSLKYGDKYWFLHANTDGTYTTTPCIYDQLLLPWFDGLPHNYMWVKKKWQYGIISLEADWSILDRFPCMLTNNVPFKSWRAIITSDKSNFSYILDQQPDGSIRETLVPLTNIITYSDEGILQKSDKHIRIYHKNKDNSFSLGEVIDMDSAVDEWMYGLQPWEYWVSQNNQIGIMRLIWIKKEILVPCTYEAREAFGSFGLAANEACVVRDGKMGIISRDGDVFTEVCPCEYHRIDTHRAHRVWDVVVYETRKKDVFGNLMSGLIINTPDGIYKDIIVPEYEEMEVTPLSYHEEIDEDATWFMVKLVSSDKKHHKHMIFIDSNNTISYHKDIEIIRQWDYLDYGQYLKLESDELIIEDNESERWYRIAAMRDGALVILSEHFWFSQDYQPDWLLKVKIYNEQEDKDYIGLLRKDYTDGTYKNILPFTTCVEALRDPFYDYSDNDPIVIMNNHHNYYMFNKLKAKQWEEKFSMYRDDGTTTLKKLSWEDIIKNIRENTSLQREYINLREYISYNDHFQWFHFVVDEKDLRVDIHGGRRSQMHMSWDSQNIAVYELRYENNAIIIYPYTPEETTELIKNPQLAEMIKEKQATKDDLPF